MVIGLVTSADPQLSHSAPANILAKEGSMQEKLAIRETTMEKWIFPSELFIGHLLRFPLVVYSTPFVYF